MLSGAPVPQTGGRGRGQHRLDHGGHRRRLLGLPSAPRRREPRFPSPRPAPGAERDEGETPENYRASAGTSRAAATRRPFPSALCLTGTAAKMAAAPPVPGSSPLRTAGRARLPQSRAVARGLRLLPAGALTTVAESSTSTGRHLSRAAGGGDVPRSAAAGRQHRPRPSLPTPSGPQPGRPSWPAERPTVALLGGVGPCPAWPPLRPLPPFPGGELPAVAASLPRALFRRRCGPLTPP